MNEEEIDVLINTEHYCIKELEKEINNLQNKYKRMQQIKSNLKQNILSKLKENLN